MYQPQQSSYNAHYPQYSAPQQQQQQQQQQQTQAQTQTPVVSPFYPGFTQQLKSSTPPPPEPPSSPDLSSISPQIASKLIQRLIISELIEAGFDSANPAAVQRLECEVVAFIEQLFERAHEYANLSNRTGAIATDLVMACREFNLPYKTLRDIASRSSSSSSVKGKKKAEDETRHAVAPPTLVAAPSRSPSPELLSSDDDENAPPVIPPTLRGLPSYFPELPPKHTYLRTPASPPKKAALPSLEKKLKTASLVQESLKNLLLATEDNTNQEDGELLGHIVNWEMGVHPRKRWRIGS